MNLGAKTGAPKYFNLMRPQSPCGPEKITVTAQSVPKCHQLYLCESFTHRSIMNGGPFDRNQSPGCSYLNSSNLVKPRPMMKWMSSGSTGQCRIPPPGRFDPSQALRRNHSGTLGRMHAVWRGMHSGRRRSRLYCSSYICFCPRPGTYTCALRLV